MPAIDFTVQAGNAFQVLEGFARDVGLGNIALEHMAVNFTKVNTRTGEYETSISGITTTHQKLTAVLRQTAAGIDLVNVKLQETPKAAAASRKTMAASLKLAEAKSVRGALESYFPTNGFSRTEIDSQRSKISQIASLVERGRASVAEYSNAAAASAGHIATTTLNETEQKILNIIKRIETAQERANTKSKQLYEKQKTGTTNERFGAATALRLQREFGGQVEGLNPAAQERVKRQFEQIQALFSKGLDKTGYQRALKAMEGDTTITLTKIEAEVRHRLGRIHVELDRSSSNKGWLNKLFGGDAGGGLTDKAGGTSKVIGGLLLAQGIDQAANTIKTLANDTADFQKQIALLRTLTQDTTGSFNDWEASILRVSGAVGKSKEEIASAGYDLLSNQITKGVGDTEVALNKVARFANVTNSSVRDSGNLLASAINSFGLDASHTDEILGSLFTTIDLGRVVASDLSNTLGRPAVAAKSLGLSMHELEAAMITISQTGLGVEQTNTLITNVFHKLLNPTDELKQHYKDLGVSTGEMYVKQLGLVGVLEDMIKLTGGSAAELAKYFNEIRGEQGITQLTSRINVLKDALSKLKNNKTYAGALAEFDQLPGQRFHEEIQKYSNAFLKFKDIALGSLIYVTDGVGGLSNALVIGTGLATGLGIVLTGLYGLHIFSRMSGEASQLLEVVGLLGPKLAVGVAVATGLGIGAGALHAEYDDAKHAAEIFAEEGKQTATQQAAAMAAINAKMATSNEETLKKMQQQALTYISKVKVGLQNLADAQKTTFKAVADELKDSFELVGQALKRVITQGEEKERHLVDNIAKRPEKLRDIHDKKRDDLYDARMVTNRVRVGLGAPDMEGKIQKQRIGELLAEARKLSKSGNPKNADRAQELMEKAQGIAHERRTATTSVPIFDGNGDSAGTVDIMKYVDGNRMANFLIKERVRLLKEADLAQKAALETQRLQNEKDRAASKLLQDRANDVTGFKLFNEKGELNYRTPEKAMEELERRIQGYLKQAEAVARGQGVTPEAALATAKTLADVRNRTSDQLARIRGTTGDQLETHRNQLAAGKKGDQTSKAYENQIAKVRDLKKEMDEASEEEARFRNASIASFKTLETHSTRTDLGVVGKYLSNAGQVDAHGNVRGLSFSEAVNRIPPEAQSLLARARKSTEGNDPRTALNFVDQAIAKVKQLGGAEEEFLGTNGETTNVGKYLKDLRVQLSLTLNAQERWKAAAVVSDNQTAQASRMIGLLNSFAEKYTSVSAAAEQFATVSEDSFRAVNKEANQMVSSMATMLRQLDSMTNVANNIRNATAEIQQGINPSLVDPKRDERPVIDISGPPKLKLFGGAVSHFAEGGFMSDFMGGKYARGSDRHPAMLAGGESVNNQRATSRFAAQIIAMNAGFEPSFAGGRRGESGQQYTFGDIHVHAKSGDSAAKTTRELGAAMKREIRRGSLNL